MQIKNKTAWITGAGSGIGRALAELIVAKGGKCILSDINPESLAETTRIIKEDAVLLTQVVDVGDRAELQAFIKKTIASYPVDIVINNAGTTLQPRTIEESTYENFEWLFNINMWGVLIGSKSFYRTFIRAQRHILSIYPVYLES